MALTIGLVGVKGFDGSMVFGKPQLVALRQQVIDGNLGVAIEVARFGTKEYDFRRKVLPLVKTHRRCQGIVSFC
jgi:hypothetical protein